MRPWYFDGAFLRNDPALITICSTVGAAPSSRLAFARVRAGYATAIGFARAHDIPQATYALHESGQRGIRPDVAEKYARLLGNCTAEWLLYGKGSGPGDPDAGGIEAAFQEIGGEPEKVAAFMLLHDRFTILAEQYEDAMGKGLLVPRLLGYRNDARGRIKAVFSLWQQIVNMNDDLPLMQRVQDRLALLERGIAEFIQVRAKTPDSSESEPIA